MKKVIIFDTTLRDGESAAGASLNLQEKLEIARQLEKLGVDVIEAGFPVTSPGDFEAVSLIAKEVRTPVICVLTHANLKAVDQSWEAVKEAAEAQVRLIERQLQDATITIPLHGVISERYVEVGELVSVGSLMATVIDLKHVWVMAYVSEIHLGNVKLGQEGKVSVDSFPEKEFIGKVTYISPEAEFTPKNIQTKEERVTLVFGVKIELDNPDQELKLGMPADAILALDN